MFSSAAGAIIAAIIGAVTAAGTTTAGIVSSNRAERAARDAYNKDQDAAELLDRKNRRSEAKISKENKEIAMEQIGMQKQTNAYARLRNRMGDIAGLVMQGETLRNARLNRLSALR